MEVGQDNEPPPGVVGGGRPDNNSAVAGIVLARRNSIRERRVLCGVLVIDGGDNSIKCDKFINWLVGSDKDN